MAPSLSRFGDCLRSLTPNRGRSRSTEGRHGDNVSPNPQTQAVQAATFAPSEVHVSGMTAHILLDDRDLSF